MNLQLDVQQQGYGDKNAGPRADPQRPPILVHTTGKLFAQFCPEVYLLRISFVLQCPKVICADVHYKHTHFTNTLLI